MEKKLFLETRKSSWYDETSLERSFPQTKISQMKFDNVQVDHLHINITLYAGTCVIIWLVPKVIRTDVPISLY